METIKKATIKEGQTLFDIAVLETGRTEGAFDLAAANNRAITDLLENGEKIGLTEVLDSSAVKYLRDFPLTPATEDPYRDADFSHCIGYMVIGSKPVDETGLVYGETYPKEEEGVSDDINMESIFKIL